MALGALLVADLVALLLDFLVFILQLDGDRDCWRRKGGIMIGVGFFLRGGLGCLHVVIGVVVV